MVTKLIVASGKSAGRVISIKRNSLLIGRSEDCDVRPLSEEVSRRHCAVHVGPSDVWLEDLGSRNGTFLNGLKITEKTKVVEGDVIRVGTLELKVSCSDPAAKAGTAEDVSRWLMADERPAGMFDTTQTLRPAEATASQVAVVGGDPVAEQSVARAGDPVRADESFVSGINALPEALGGPVTATGESSLGRSASSLAIEALKSAKANPGALPPVAKKSAADSSRDAAAEALKKFFDKR